MNFAETLGSPYAAGLLLRVAFAAALLFLASFAVRRRISAAGGGVIPDEGVTLRNIFEVLLAGLTTLARQTMGPEWKRWFPFVGAMFFFILVAALIYLAITTVSNLVLIWLEKRYSIGVRHAEL